MTAAKIFLNCRNPVAICPLLYFSALAVDYDPVRLAQITVLAYSCYRRVKRRCSPAALPVHESVVICGAVRIDIIAETFCRIIDDVVCVGMTTSPVNLLRYPLFRPLAKTARLSLSSDAATQSMFLMSTFPEASSQSLVPPRLPYRH